MRPRGLGALQVGLHHVGNGQGVALGLSLIHILRYFFRISSMKPFAMNTTMMSTMMAMTTHTTHMGTMPNNDSILFTP